MIVLSDRACGSVAGGGLYASGIPRVGGTLLSLTAISAPFDAEIANPRRAEAVAMGPTLDQAWGLVAPTGTDEPYKGLPAVGMADLWGQNFYTNVWDAISETASMGPCRRVSHVPDEVKVPYPMLMLHKHAFVEFGKSVDFVEDWLDTFAGEFDPEPAWLSACGPEGFEEHYNVFDWAWQDANKLGRIGCDDFLWHSHVALWKLAPKLKEKRLYARFLRDCEVTLSMGVCGLTWVTEIVQVLQEGQDDVDPELKSKGILPALSEHDPRAAEL